MKLSALSLLLVAALFAGFVVASPARAEAPVAGPSGNASAGPDADIVEQLGEPVPRDVPFTDSTGRPVRFGQLLGPRPVVLALVYHRCQGLCSLLLGGLVASLRSSDWRLGRDLDVVTVSIDPDEGPTQAETSRVGYLQALGAPPSEEHWASLTGPQPSIDALASAVGFRFKYIEGQRQFAHAAALFVLTPDGRVSRYLYGVDFPPTQLKAALFEASGGRVGTSFDRVILRCLRWDPAARRYHVFLTRYYRIAGLVILASFGALLATLWRRDVGRRAAVGSRA